jgi:hypothetical protein
MNDFAKLLQSVGISTAALTDQTDRLKKSLDAQAEAEAKLKREMQSKEQAQIAEALRKKLESLRIETIEASNVFSRQLAPGLAQTAVQMKLVEASFFEGNKAILALPPSVQKLNEAMLGLQGMKLTQEFLTPWDQYALKLDQIDLLHQKGKITEEVRVAASQKAAMALAATYSSAAGQIAGAFGEMFTAIGGDQKDWVRASKIAMAAQALFSSFAASAEALVGPFPGNLAAAAIVLAKGLSLVAAIKGTPIGMAHGGSFNIAGPAGIDRVPVSFMATAGERVTVETPGKPRRQDSATLNVTGVRSGDYFRGDVVRDIVNGILEWQRDSGGRVLFDASRA